jgi:hypothetical protein
MAADLLETKEIPSPEGGWWNTLGAAHFRAGEWKLAVEALTGRALSALPGWKEIWALIN